MNYEPLTDPFELPVQRLTAFCQTERSFVLPPRAGTIPGTTLWGAFGQALWQTACLSRRIGCAASVGARGCRFPQLCPIPWLYKPYSEVHRRNMDRPVLLHARALERHQPVEAFEIEVTLWGRHAVTAREAVLRTLTAMGASGLNVNEQSVRFQIMEIRADPVRTIAECTASLCKLDWPQALLVFETLMSYRETVEIEPGVKKKLFLAGGTLPLPKIVGNCAFKLVAWDLEDREVGEAFDEDTRNRLCREAREAAQQTVGELEIVHWGGLGPLTGDRDFLNKMVAIFSSWVSPDRWNCGDPSRAPCLGCSPSCSAVAGRGVRWGLGGYDCGRASPIDYYPFYRPPPLEPPVDHFCEWLKGKWLEDHVLQKVWDVKDRCSLHDWGGGLDLAQPNSPQWSYFEIDVVAIRGYQLFAISCTTSSDFKECKLKLFEVYVRAPQLGGDEARIGLVCMVNDPSQLQRELEQAWNAEKGKIKVFGKRDLPRLESQLQQWFEGKI
jgi:hypothetical protein